MNLPLHPNTWSGKKLSFSNTSKRNLGGLIIVQYEHLSSLHFIRWNYNCPTKPGLFASRYWKKRLCVHYWRVRIGWERYRLAKARSSLFTVFIVWHIFALSYCFQQKNMTYLLVRRVLRHRQSQSLSLPLKGVTMFVKNILLFCFT